MTASTCQYSLGLDNDDEDQPYRFVELPCGSLLAFGGDDGQISCLQQDAEEKNFVVLHRYDDGVRAVAVSKDGKRVAVGFEDGSTKVYTFENTYTHPHPFAQLPKQDEDNLLLSQDVSTQLDFFVGPQFDAPIRDLKFVKDYWLAVASESGMCVANVESSDSLSERKLEQEVQEHHDHCGIRGVAVHANHLLATLAMDGRICVWDFEAAKLLVRESTTCIPKKDVGEVHGADVFDRSCRPLFFRDFLATPGQLLPVLRTIKDNEVKTIDMDDSKVEDKGHIEPVVCVAYTKDYVVTSGRDARVILWECQTNSGWYPLETVSLEAPATDLLVREGKVHVALANGNHVLLEFDGLKKRHSKENATSQSTTAKATTREETTIAKPKKTINASMAEFEDDDDDDIDLDASQQATNQKEKPKKNINSSMAEFEDDDDVDDDVDVDVDLGASTKTTDEIEKPKKKLNSSMAEFEDDDDDDVDFGSTQESSKSTNRVRFVDDEAEDEDDTDKAVSKDTDVADTAVDASDDLDTPHGNDETNNDDMDDDDDDFEDLPTYTPAQAAAVPPQPAFSPSSTPLDLTRRFLCWNHIGSVTLFQGGSDRNTVDVHFTDSAYKRPISFTDNMSFIVGALGEDGGIFASDLQVDDDDVDDIEGLDDLAMSERTKQAVKKSHRKRQPDARPTGSSIFFYRYETFGKQREKDWYLNLPDGERVLGAACGEGWAAAMTR
jgi:WD40 repeat protein